MFFQLRSFEYVFVPMFLFVCLAGVRCSFDVLGSMREGTVVVEISVGRYAFDAKLRDREFRKFTFRDRDLTQQGVRALMVLRLQHKGSR